MYDELRVWLTSEQKDMEAKGGGRTYSNTESEKMPIKIFFFFFQQNKLTKKKRLKTSSDAQKLREFIASVYDFQKLP